MSDLSVTQSGRLILSATEIQDLTGWPDAMIEDYLNILRDLAATIAAINENAGDIANLGDDVDQLQIDVAALDIRVTALEARVDQLEIDVAALDVRVTQNEADIVDLDNRVTQNENDITSLDSRVTQNENDIADINDGRYSPQFGSGSPEGVVTANRNQTYYDLTGTPELWVNPTIGANTGWVQVV